MKATPVVGDSTKIRLKADKRGGELLVTRPNAAEGGMVNLQWKDRATGNPVVNKPVFPGDISFRRIRTPNAKDRVYELQYVQRADRTFFYMQEGDEAGDEGRVIQLLAAVENPTEALKALQATEAAAAGSASGGPGMPGLVGAGEEGMGSALNFSGMSGGSAPASFDLSSILGAGNNASFMPTHSGGGGPQPPLTPSPPLARAAMCPRGPRLLPPPPLEGLLG